MPADRGVSSASIPIDRTFFPANMTTHLQLDNIVPVDPGIHHVIAFAFMELPMGECLPHARPDSLLKLALNLLHAFL
jgi:hypothetical protein